MAHFASGVMLGHAMGWPAPLLTRSVEAPTFAGVWLKSYTFSASVLAPVRPTYASFVASGEKLGMLSLMPSSPLAATRVPPFVFQSPSLGPGGPGMVSLPFWTRYWPFGGSAGFDHARFCAVAGAPPRS